MTKFLARQTCLSRSMEEQGNWGIGDVSEMWLAYSFGAFALHLAHMCHTNCALAATESRRWAAGGCRHTLQAAGCSNLLTIWLTFPLLVACKCCDSLATCHMPHAACNKAEFICAGHLVLVKLQLQLPRARQLHNLY